MRSATAVYVALKFTNPNHASSSVEGTIKTIWGPRPRSHGFLSYPNKHAANIIMLYLVFPVVKTFGKTNRSKDSPSSNRRNA